MKNKYGLIIGFVFLLSFGFINRFDALTCKYENPYDKNKEIILEFTSDVKDAYTTGGKKTTTCLDTAKSSFKTINLYSNQGGNIPFVEFNGQKWSFDEKSFSWGSCVSEMLVRNNEENDFKYYCPSLGISKIKNNSGTYYVIMEDSPKIMNTCYYGECDSLVQKEGNSSEIRDENGNVIGENKAIKTCRYSLNTRNLLGNHFTSDINSNLSIIEYADGTFQANLDGSSQLLNVNKGQYFLELYSKTQLANFIIYKKDAQKFLNLTNESEGKGLNCLKEVWLYWDASVGFSGSYVIVANKSDIPSDNDDYTNAGQYGDDSTEYGLPFGGAVSSTISTCVEYLGSADTDGTIANLLDKVYFIIKVGSIILVIVMSMLDFAMNTTKSKDELMVTVKKFAIRLVILVVILLLPTLIDIVGNIMGIEEILCGIK